MSKNVLINKENGYCSVSIYDYKTKQHYVIDVSVTENGEVDCEWNQYIFYLNKKEDMIRKKRQDDVLFYEACCDRVRSILMKSGILTYDIVNGYQFGKEVQCL